MDRVQNLRKTLTKLGRKISKEISSHYTKQKEKQTTKKPDNSSQITSSPSPLTESFQDTTIVTSSQDTTERITMTKMIKEPANHAHDWCIDRIRELTKHGDSQGHYDALSIGEEFYEWLRTEPGDDLEYLAIDDDTWTQEKEIDTE